MADETPSVSVTEEGTVASTPSNGPKWKWLIGPMIGIILALLAGAVTYGSLTATAGATAEDVIKLETTLDTHTIDNDKDHTQLDLRLNKQDIGMAEQRTLLIGIDKKLDEIKDDFKGHLKEHR